MKRFLIVAACLLFLTAPSLRAQDDMVVPQGIKYKKADAEVNRKAKERLASLLAKGGLKKQSSKVLSNPLIAGPAIWAQLKTKTPDLKSTPTTMMVPMRGRNGELTAVAKLSGGLMQSDAGIKAFADAFAKAYPIKGAVTIRKLKPAEMRRYWTIISFPIEEPVFVAEIGDNQVLFDMSGKDLQVLWIEDVSDGKLKKLIAANVAAQRKKREEALAGLRKVFIDKFGSVDKGCKIMAAKGWEEVYNGKPKEGREMFDVIIQLRPDDAVGYWGKGVATLFLVGAGKEDRSKLIQVVQLEERALTLDLNNVAIMGDLIVAYSNVGRALPAEKKEAREQCYNRSADLYALAIKTDPEFAKVHVCWAISLAGRGKFAEAKKALAKAEALGGKPSEDLKKKIEAGIKASK